MFFFSSAFARPGGKVERAQVKTMQMLLGKFGFGAGKLDGWLGPKSEIALRTFQKQSGLEETGKLDEATKQLLTSARFDGDEDTKPDSRSGSRDEVTSECT